MFPTQILEYSVEFLDGQMVLLIAHFYNAELMAKCFLAIGVASWIRKEGFFGHLPTGSDLGETLSMNCSVNIALLVIKSECILF